MPFADIEQITAWLAATDITELELTGPDGALRLRQELGIVRVQPDEELAEEEITVAAKASSVGVFLHRHPLHDAPLVEIGAQVKVGHTLGLLQIGMLLLPVVAPIAGIVSGIVVADGTPVGFGADLVQLYHLTE